jgi:hypothetical protein
MSFLRFSAILYGLMWLIERFWPLLLALLIYWVVKKQWESFKHKKDE